jgi:hypothetical protein
LRFPRVIIIRPPHLKEKGQKLAEIFSKRFAAFIVIFRYGLKLISAFETLEEQIKNQSEVGKYI